MNCVTELLWEGPHKNAVVKMFGEWIRECVVSILTPVAKQQKQ